MHAYYFIMYKMQEGSYILCYGLEATIYLVLRMCIHTCGWHAISYTEL